MNSGPSHFKVIKMDARTLSWWRSRRNRIDVDPSYQRKGRRWSVSDKQYLIDSIINGFDVPKFYLADFTWVNSALNEKKQEYAVIDGKQRFEAIFDFFDGKFSLANDFKFILRPELDLAGLSYDQLQDDFPEIAEIFDNFNPHVMSVVTSNIAYVRELFVRLNRSKPLSGAEIRNATEGTLTEAVRDLRSNEFFQSNIRFDTQKGQDLNCAMKLMMFEMGDGFFETKKTSLDKFASDHANDPDVIRAERNVAHILDSMSQVFQYRDNLLRSEGQVPVYFWLFRQADEAYIPYIRDFIEQFQESIQKKRSGIVRPRERERFVFASRSINDRVSHQERFKILSVCFERWIEKNSLTSRGHTIASKYVLSGPIRGQFHFVLKAGNGATILTSERYTSKVGANTGIQSVKKNAATDGRYVRKKSKNGHSMFNLRAANGEIIGTSETYSSDAAREAGIASVKANGPTAPIDDQTTG